MNHRNSIPRAIPLIVLAPALLWLSCIGSVPSARSPETANNAASSQARTAGAESEPKSIAVIEGSSKSTGTGPVIYRPEKPTDVFPPAPADGLIGIAVPALVSEPITVYRTDPQTLAFTETLVMTDVPQPRRREGPPRAKAPEPTASSASTLESPKSSLFDASSLEGSPPPAPLAPAISTSFDSLEFDDNSANNAGFLFVPPDPSGAAGPNHVMNVTNVSVQIHTKSGAEVLDTTAGAPITGISLASFFATLSPANSLFDPKVIYDQHADLRQLPDPVRHRRRAFRHDGHRSPIRTSP